MRFGNLPAVHFSSILSLTLSLSAVIASRTRYAMKKAGWSSILVAALLLTVGAMAEAQQPTKIPLIGSLSGSSPSTSRPAPRHSALAAELVRLKVDIIVTAVEHKQRCGLPFTDSKKNSPRLFQSKKVPAEQRLVPDQRCRAAIKLWGKTPDHQLTRKTRLRALPHAPINEGET
jgi:hypothetical protein